MLNVSSNYVRNVRKKALLQLVNYLLDHGAEINARNNLGKTPLHRAADANIGYTVAVNLIDRGAEINARDDGGKTPLLLATLQNNKALLDRLVGKARWIMLEFGGFRQSQSE